MITATRVRAVTIVGLLVGAFSNFETRADGVGQAHSKELFKLCAACHGLHGEGKADIGAPAIAGQPQDYVKKQLIDFREGTRGKHQFDDLGMKMRPMARMLKENEIEDMASYVASLPRVHHEPTIKGDVAKGKEAYELCSACHGPNAEGNAEVKGPPLQAQGWYNVKQIKNYQQGIRGNNPEKDPLGVAMVPMAASLSDEAAINDVIAYIESLNSKK